MVWERWNPPSSSQGHHWSRFLLDKKKSKRKDYCLLGKKYITANNNVQYLVHLQSVPYDV